MLRTFQMHLVVWKSLTNMTKFTLSQFDKSDDYITLSQFNNSYDDILVYVRIHWSIGI